MKEIVNYYREGFRNAHEKRKRFTGRRIGSELKFPFVREDGYAAEPEMVNELWRFLQSNGWRVITDPITNDPVGAEIPGEFNTTVARVETGYCLIEFALAHVGDLHDLMHAYDELRTTLNTFSEKTGSYLLSCGMHPRERPGRHLRAAKSRNLFWDRVFGSNRIVPPEEGTDVDLFALSAAHQVHLDIDLQEAIKAVNVLNGFAGAQIALNANSMVWQGTVSQNAHCLGELFWDWWLGDERHRAGVPERYFDSLSDYANLIAEYSPVFTHRGNDVIGLLNYSTFREYFSGNDPKSGVDKDGRTVPLTPSREDISIHNTFFWHTARISWYFTIENRLNDQQPYDEMIVIPALSLGIIENLEAADTYVRSFKWSTLRSLRNKAIHAGLDAHADGVQVADMCRDMITIAYEGLKSRNSNEEKYLDILYSRIENGINPARGGAEILKNKGLETFLYETRI